MCLLGRFFCLYRLMTRFGSCSTCWTPAGFCLCRAAREANFEHISWHNLFRVQSGCPVGVQRIINRPLHKIPLSLSHLEAKICSCLPEEFGAGHGGRSQHTRGAAHGALHAATRRVGGRRGPSIGFALCNLCYKAEYFEENVSISSVNFLRL